MTDVVVVGAGVFGAWSAWRLAEDGHRVRLIDAYGPANGRASSADTSRVIRAGYGHDAWYSQSAAAAWSDWTWLATTCGQELLTRTGALFMGAPDDTYVRASHATLQALGIGAEWLDPGEVARRFPQIRTTGLGAALYEPDAGVLRARAAVRALVDIACRRAGVIYETGAILPLDEDQSGAVVRSTDGSRLPADIYVLACGPWLPRLLPRSIGARIRSTRQEVLYFGTPAGDSRFSAPRLPVWIDFASGVYGIPDLDAHGFKVGVDRHGPPFDPDASDRLVDHRIVAEVRGWMAKRFPAMAQAPLLDARVCQYENTASGDFIIDHHPAWPNVWIVGGGSGHGFKHGPSVGRYVSDRIAGRGSPEPRFGLAAAGAEPRRMVF